MLRFRTDFQVNKKWRGSDILVVDQADYVGGRVRSVTHI